MTDAEIVARYLAGERVKRLSSARGNAPVYRALRRAGIEPRRTRQWWAEAAKLSAIGMCNNAIAIWLGRNRSSVAYALRQLRETRPSP